jgi:DNA/RNA endonuclease YhcR with UshA esterase domain
LRERWGQKVTVCSKVYGVKSLEKVSFINLGANYPNSLLTIVIFASAKGNFKQPLETLYSDKNICVTGTLKEYNNKPEIIISKPEDIIIQ